MGGAQWLLEGFYLFRRNPPLMIFVVFSYWLLLLLVNLLPVVGPALASILVPALSIGVMNACRAIDLKGPVRLDVALSGFRDHPRALLQLGVIYLGGTLFILMAVWLFDNGDLMRIMQADSASTAQSDDVAPPLLALQVALALMLPFLMAFWFAPMLVAWNGVSALKAVFFSFVASWRNWRAFLVYLAVTVAVTVLLPGTILAVVGSAGEPLPSPLVTFLTLPLVLIFVPSFFASFYVSYRNVFGIASTHGTGG